MSGRTRVIKDQVTGYRFAENITKRPQCEDVEHQEGCHGGQAKRYGR
ncbi:MAG: hypothetical protein GVY02_07235 [Bacteroidetes bacterium]|nr:hypothetical protein [Bacteroidota bacterium]